MKCENCEDCMSLINTIENGFGKLWHCEKCNFQKIEIQDCDHDFVTQKHQYSPSMMTVMTKCIKCDKHKVTHKKRSVDLDKIEFRDFTKVFDYNEKATKTRKILYKEIENLRFQIKKTTKEWKIQQWYYGYLESNIWRRKRNWILQKANYKCERCGKDAKFVHHKTYDRVGYELPEDLMAVCKSCHGKEHSENKGLDIVSQFRLDCK